MGSIILQDTVSPNLGTETIGAALCDRLSISKPYWQICCPSLSHNLSVNMIGTENIEKTPVPETGGRTRCTCNETIRVFHDNASISKSILPNVSPFATR